ncbi:MAG: ParB/RepB/Spo0J family partition protein [Gammaproteobacteria bacterium]|nr:ParB/RepB/Spo0J family partition protein [Gammaproteobacteria bacterium]
MVVKKRGLGRGLNELLAAARPAAATAEVVTTVLPATAPVAERELHTLPVDLMQRGKYQPRVDMHPESLEELASSIRAQGLVQPIVVRPIGGGRYEIIAGERRWRASQMAGLQEIPVVVRDVPDQAAMAMALIENIQREDLNPIEEARALQRLILEFSLTHQETADAVGRSRAAVSNLLRLLELHDEVRTMLEHGDIEMGHARALLALTGEDQRAAARKVVAQGLSVRETERLVKQLQAETAVVAKAAKVSVDPDIQRLEQFLSESLATQVQIKHGPKGKGQLVISYTSLDELDGVLVRLGKPEF